MHNRTYYVRKPKVGPRRFSMNDMNDAPLLDSCLSSLSPGCFRSDATERATTTRLATTDGPAF